MTENSTTGSDIIIFMDPPRDRICDQAIFCGIKMTYDAWISNFFSGLFARTKDYHRNPRRKKKRWKEKTLQKKRLHNVFQSYKLQDKSEYFVIIGLLQNFGENRERWFSRAIDHDARIPLVYNRWIRISLDVVGESEKGEDGGCKPPKGRGDRSSSELHIMPHKHPQNACHHPWFALPPRLTSRLQ